MTTLVRYSESTVSKPVKPKKSSAKKLSTLQGKTISSAAVKPATKNVDKKTTAAKSTAAKSKITQVKAIKKGRARPPLAKPDSRPRGSSESLRQAIEALERSQVPSPENAVEVVAAKKRKSTPRKSEPRKKPR